MGKRLENFYLKKLNLEKENKIQSLLYKYFAKKVKTTAKINAILIKTKGINRDHPLFPRVKQLKRRLQKLTKITNIYNSKFNTHKTKLTKYYYLYLLNYYI